MKIGIGTKLYGDLQGQNEVAIKSKLYHKFQSEVAKYTQAEASEIIGVEQASISRALNHPEKASISWFLKCLKKLGYECTFTIDKWGGKG